MKERLKVHQSEIKDFYKDSELITGDQRIWNSINFWSHVLIFAFCSKNLYPSTTKFVRKLGIRGYW